MASNILVEEAKHTVLVTAHELGRLEILAPGTMESMLGGNLDYAWFGSSGYAGMYLQNPDAVVPVLTRMQPTGDTGYYSVMLARKDSDIKTLADAKVRRPQLDLRLPHPVDRTCRKARPAAF